MALILSIPSKSQTCSCESNFEWMKKTFEENDAGFQYIIDTKGQTSYDLHSKQILEKIKAAENTRECGILMNEWLLFFRSGHIGLSRLTYEPLTTDSQTVSQTEIWQGDISQFEKYIRIKTDADFEGIWEISPYKIGIKKEGINYIGFIIESGVESWEPSMVKLKIEQDSDTLKTTYYMRDHSIDESDNPELLGKNYLQLGDFLLKRISPIFEDDRYVDNYLKSINSQTPFLDSLNETTLYLRIPSFAISEKPAIDSVIDTNKDKILKTENLIIDLRYNGGGSDDSFDELLPIIYTNPIRTIGVEFLSTPVNNEYVQKLSTEPDLTEEIRMRIKNIYDKLQENLGKFVCIDDSAISVFRQDTVYQYPKNIGIIINKGCASTTEQFLLAAKESKKVKLFRVTTYGALDISNTASIESPCNEYQLNYCLSRSYRVPDMTIDNIGLQPDFYLDKSIPQYKWVEFINDILNQ